MLFFRLPERDPGRFEEDTTFLKFARYILLLFLFCGVGAGFWLNSQRQAALLAKPASRVVDATDSLTGEQKKLLSEYAEKFFTTYGISIAIRIQDEPFPEEVLSAPEKARTLFLGLSPGSRQVRLEVPPLAAVPLGEDCIAYLRHEHFSPYFARNDWREGLVSALNLLTEKLDQALPGRGGTTQRSICP